MRIVPSFKHVGVHGSLSLSLCLCRTHPQTHTQSLSLSLSLSLSDAVAVVDAYKRGRSAEPLMWVQVWDDMLPPAVLAGLWTTEFFPRWLGTLREWLAQPQPDYDEVAQWYLAWKAALPADLRAHPAVAMQFNLCVVPPSAPTDRTRTHAHAHVCVSLSHVRVTLCRGLDLMNQAVGDA
jgi:hypothetical protein